MNQFLENTLRNNQFLNSKGEIIKISSHTDYEQCIFLQELIIENSLSKSIEIGFAFGASTATIASAIQQNGGAKHIVVDKFEISDWGSNGIELCILSGVKPIIDFREDYCYNVLAKLMGEGAKFDFAYIDSTKQFDWIFANFFLIDKLLDVNGLIVFDDVCFPGIKKVVRFIAKLPHYKVFAKYHSFGFSKKRQFLKKIIGFIPNGKTLFRDDIIITDYDLSINYGCIAFQKIGEDTRNWDFHVDF